MHGKCKAAASDGKEMIDAARGVLCKKRRKIVA